MLIESEHAAWEERHPLSAEEERGRVGKASLWSSMTTRKPGTRQQLIRTDEVRGLRYNCKSQALHDDAYLTHHPWRGKPRGC